MQFKRVIPVSLTLAIVIASCDLLKPRDPQSPGTGNTANPPATSPQMLIDNLTSSFANKDVNEYEKIFSDTGSVGRDYIFVPTQKAAGDYSAFFLNWTKVGWHRAIPRYFPDLQRQHSGR